MRAPPAKHPRRGKDCNAKIGEWRVLDRHCNYSAFNGNNYTPSLYSACKCMKCKAVWRTKADYVAQIADATPREILL